ncbi:hypothetical protein GCM10010502_51760 [Kitasatospora aureofaciens]|uniref:Uncharacterized protein n=1 Tax=Kitasatospora aureofaciens TaxID=1894 RepID=A0A8H9LU05_KITAU|nr:hypothetical protein GCM10010502_51760 [Kitasatospora aureofaciens]
MPEKVFSTALQKRVQLGRQDPELVDEAVRRAEAGSVPVLGGAGRRRRSGGVLISYTPDYFEDGGSDAGSRRPVAPWTAVPGGHRCCGEGPVRRRPRPAPWDRTS